MPEAGFPRRVIIGEEASSALLNIAEYYGLRKVLVVTDKGIASSGILEGLVATLRNADVEVEVFDGIEPEPRVDDVRKLAESVRDRGFEAVIAVGGGSVIDAAKAFTLLLANPDADPIALAPFQPVGLEKHRPLLVAVPTTAGTGSDWSYALVLTVIEDESRRKEPAANFEIVPHIVILDPSLPSRAPRRVAVGAIADALGHAIEAYVAAQSNPVSEALAEHAVRLIFRSAEKAVKEGDQEAWLNLHAAASMAGAAFSSAGLGIVHAIAHPLGAILGIHHGTLVGIVLPHVIKFYYERSPQVKGKLERLRLILETVEGLPSRPTLYHHVVGLYNAIDQPYTLTQLGFKEEQVAEIAEKVGEEALHDPDIAFAPYVPDVNEIIELVKGLTRDPLST